MGHVNVRAGRNQREAHIHESRSQPVEESVEKSVPIETPLITTEVGSVSDGVHDQPAKLTFEEVMQLVAEGKEVRGGKIIQHQSRLNLSVRRLFSTMGLCVLRMQHTVSCSMCGGVEYKVSKNFPLLTYLADNGWPDRFRAVGRSKLKLRLMKNLPYRQWPRHSNRGNVSKGERPLPAALLVAMGRQAIGEK